MLDVDDDQIQAFLETDYDRVVRVVTAVCGDRQRAQDAVQDSLVDAWKRSRDLDDVSRWITVASINRARSRWRSHAAERRAFERLATQRANREQHEPEFFDARLAQALKALPRAQRQVVALHYLMDLSIADIAGCLGSAEGTVKTHLHRGRAALRAALGPTAQQEGDARARS